MGTVTPNLVIFDCDGVLVDSERLEVGTIAEALTWMGADIDAESLHDRHRGGALTNLVALIETAIGEPVPDWFLTRYRALQFERLAEVEIVPGADAVVEYVVDAGWQRCVVSGGPIAKMEISLTTTGLWDSFSPHIYSCYDIADHKPSPGIYLHALAALGAEADDCIAIEDSATGVAASVAAGVPVIGLARDSSSDDLVAAGARHVVGGMAEVRDLLDGLQRS